MLEIFLALSPSKAIKWDLTRAIALSSYHFKAYNNYYYFFFFKQFQVLLACLHLIVRVYSLKV